MQKITIVDYALLPVYLSIFYYFVVRKASTYDIELRKIFLTAFWLRMFGCFAYSMVLQYYYGGAGDSFTYYEGSDFLHEQLSKNLGNIKYFFASPRDFQQWFNSEVSDANLTGYMGISSATAVMKIAAVFSFLAFNKFLIISLFFALFSFAGQWRLFQVFNDYGKGKNQKLLAYAVLYSPSIWFWGSGLMKDSICLGAMGFIIYILYNNLVKKQISLRQWLLLPCLIFLVYIIKSYIIVILMASIMVVFFFRYILLVKNILMRIIAILFFLIASAIFFAVSNFSGQINDLVEESYTQVQTFQLNYQNLQSGDENSKAGFELGAVDASLGSMLLKGPGVIFTCLYRPFIWESRKIIILFTALESTLLLLSTLYLLYKTRVTGFFKIIFSNHLILFCFVLSMLFALIIGFTTFNFGTMTRYKIILMPFYYFMLVIIYNKVTEKEKAATTQLTADS
jgi:hypothetical protein